MTITILGAGAWGTALATLFAHNGHDVVLWSHETDLIDEMLKHHENKKYLPDIFLNSRISATSDLGHTVARSQVIVLAIPVKFLRTVLQQIPACDHTDKIWVVASKGIEQDSLLFCTQILDDVCGDAMNKVVISGPSFAYDLARKDITGMMVASNNPVVAEQIQEYMANVYCRPFITEDVLGVQLAAVCKNIITLGVGMLSGAGFGDNARSFMLTRGLHEMTNLGVAMGAQRDTFYGLAGVGDLVLTAMGSHSKNLKVGRRLGMGHSLDVILQDTGYIPEGINSIYSLKKLMQQYRVRMPLCEGIYNVLVRGIPLHDMLAHIMNPDFYMPRTCCESY